MSELAQESRNSAAFSQATKVALSVVDNKKQESESPPHSLFCLGWARLDLLLPTLRAPSLALFQSAHAPHVHMCPCAHAPHVSIVPLCTVHVKVEAASLVGTAAGCARSHIAVHIAPCRLSVPHTLSSRLHPVSKIMASQTNLAAVLSSKLALATDAKEIFDAKAADAKLLNDAAHAKKAQEDAAKAVMAASKDESAIKEEAEVIEERLKAPEEGDNVEGE